MICAATLSPSVTAHFAHIVAKARDLHAAAVVDRRGDAYPALDLALRAVILPVSDDDGIVLAHARADETELAATVRGLVEVHEVHVHAVPRNLSIELGMELHEGFVQHR